MRELLRRDFLKLGLFTTVALGGSISLFGNDNTNTVAVLMYHDVNSYSKDPYTVSPADFAAEMEWLFREGYTTLFVDEVESFVRRGGKKGIVLTFDDGYFSFLSYAYPFLSRYGFKATINIIGESVGAWTTYRINRPMLSWDEYRYLLGEGRVRLGCHSYRLHHEPSAIFKLSEGELLDDLSHFQETLKAETGKISSVMAWPFGEYRQQHIESAKKIGFEYFLTSNEGYWNIIENGIDMIPRLSISYKLDLISYRQYIRGGKNYES